MRCIYSSGPLRECVRGIYGSGPGGAGQRRIFLKVRDTLAWARRATQRQNRKRTRRADFPGDAGSIRPKRAGTNIPPEIDQHPGPCDCLDRNQRGQAWAGQQRCTGMPGCELPRRWKSFLAGTWQFHPRESGAPAKAGPGSGPRQVVHQHDWDGGTSCGSLCCNEVFPQPMGAPGLSGRRYFPVSKGSAGHGKGPFLWCRQVGPSAGFANCLPVLFTPQRQLEAGRLHAWPRLLRPLICWYPLWGFGRKGRCRMAPDQPGKVTKKSCGLVSPGPPAEPGHKKGTGVMGCHPWGKAIRGELLAFNLLRVKIRGQLAWRPNQSEPGQDAVAAVPAPTQPPRMHPPPDALRRRGQCEICSRPLAAVAQPQSSGECAGCNGRQRQPPGEPGLARRRN